MAELMLGNVAIERHIQVSEGTNFGVGRQRLIEAVSHFGGVAIQLRIVHSYVNRIIDMIGNPEYEPFDLTIVDVDTFIERCIAAGLLSDARAARTAIEVIKTEGYNGIFFRITDLIDGVVEKVDILTNLTNVMVNGPEGMQGYFWTNVEANRNSWRTDFMAVLTALTDLITFWATTAAVCTEVHLMGVQAPSLLIHVNTSIAG
jgi:hypothetical protein